jgi:lysophospholipase L1-like esterase
MEYIISFLICGYFFLVTAWIIYFSLCSKKLSKKTISYQEKDKTGDFSILFLGDSVVRGVGVCDPKDSLAGLTKKHIPCAKITVFAKDGARIDEISSLLQRQPKKKYDQIIIFCGGMDIIKFSKAQKIKERLHELFSYTKTMSSNIVYVSPPDVGISEIFPFPLSLLYSYRSKKFLEYSRACAERCEITFVDYFSFENKEYASDKSHPNEKGYKHMFDIFKTYILQ